MRGLDSEPWLTDATRVADALATDPQRGLTRSEARDRLAESGPNRIDPEPSVPAWRRVVEQFRDPLVLLLLAAVAISAITWGIEGARGIPYESLVIAVILVANAALGYVQEARAERAVAALQRMAAATSSVVRDGAVTRIASEDVVPGDVLLLTEGDAVSADARLVEALSLNVAEAPLTGESEAVVKDVATLQGRTGIADRTNMVFAGTAVTRGRGRAVVVATGMATEMGRIAGLLGRTKDDPTPLQREIRRVGRFLAIAVLLIATVVVGAIFLTSDIDRAADVVDVLLVGVSLAVAAVPEGLPAVLSVVLALGVQRMARKNAIVTKLSSVETLGSASVICSDKTGTLTKNEMTIQRILTRSGTATLTGIGYRPEGALLVDGEPLSPGPLHDEVHAVLAGGSLANDASLREEDGSWTIFGDPTDAAFLVAERKAGFTADRQRRYRRTGEVPFTSERKLMSTFHEDVSRPRPGIVTKGAPDVLLDRCTAELVGRRAVRLDDDRRREILAGVDALAGEAYRTLAVAFRPLPDGTEPGEEAERELIFAGVVGVIDPPRPEVRSAIDESRRAGVRIVMITGDHPRTAERIATELGILEADGRTVAGSEIDELDESSFRAVARTAAVYARVAPEHKLRIVEALKADGHIVAMTGDGVNDAPALKRADIGIAMGMTGTDVTKEAAKMVLADDNFATIVAAVREGRTIFSNIRRFLRYLLSSNAGEVLTMLLGVLGAGIIGLDDAGGAVAVPILATQILWINLLTDTGPALALGADPPPHDVMARPPRRLTDRVIDLEMQRGVLFVGLVMAVVTLMALDLRLPGGLVEGDGGIAEARTMAFTTLVVAQLFNCFNARSDRTSAFDRFFTNPLLWGAIAVSLLLQVAVVYVPFLNRAFATAPLGFGDWLVCVTLASAVLWADELRKVFVRAFRR